MTRTDEQLIADVRAAVASAPTRPSVVLDDVVAGGRHRVATRRAVGAGGLLVTAAAAGALAFTTGVVGSLGASPSDPAGEGGREAPSVNITEQPESPTQLYEALGARLQSMGLSTDNVSWGSGGMLSDPSQVESGFTAMTSLGFALEAVRTKEPMDLDSDLCGEWGQGELTCSRTTRRDGAHLVQVKDTDSAGVVSTVSLRVVHAGGWVGLQVLGSDLEGQPVLPGTLTEEEMLEIATDPALRW